jgi:hypothetical protein
MFRAAAIALALVGFVAGCSLPPASVCPRDVGGPPDQAASPLDAATAVDRGPDATSPGFESYGRDCPKASPSSLPADSPRILILGPSPNAEAIAAHLQGLLAADAAFKTPVVSAAGTKVELAADPNAGGISLMSFFYVREGRAKRLAPLAEPWSYVVLLEEPSFAKSYPELYFEGVRVLGCHARALGAKPVVLMNWPYTTGTAASQDTAVLGELAYRVANGTGSIVAPAGYAKEALPPMIPAHGPDAGWGADDVFIDAATLYSTLTGRDAAATGYQPPGLSSSLATQLAKAALDTVISEAGKVHYQTAFHGAVELSTAQPKGELWFMVSGSSSEQIWYDRMNEILPKVGLTPKGTQIGYTNPQKMFDEAALAKAVPYFQTHQYQILFARTYDGLHLSDEQLTPGSGVTTIRTAGGQTDLQVQVWDRHADSVSSDGAAAVNMMEGMLTWKRSESGFFGLALIPYHLMFAKLKTMRPAIQLLSDGTHATYAVGYGLATMSVVSRTGIHVPTEGLDADTRLAVELADETIRQLSSLSVSGAFVPDDPGTRPKSP